MEPTIHKPGAYKSTGIYKGAGGIYNGRGVYNDGSGVSNIWNMDIEKAMSTQSVAERGNIPGNHGKM